jgi:hypothetical protein
LPAVRDIVITHPWHIITAMDKRINVQKLLFAGKTDFFDP